MKRPHLTGKEAALAFIGYAIFGLMVVGVIHGHELRIAIFGGAS